MFKQMNESFKEKVNKPLCIICFISFLLLLIWITIFKANMMDTVKIMAECNVLKNYKERLKTLFFFGFF